MSAFFAAFVAAFASLSHPGAHAASSFATTHHRVTADAVIPVAKAPLSFSPSTIHGPIAK